MRFRSVGIGAIVLAAACGEPTEVHRYTVAKERPKQASPGVSTGGPRRMLAAIFLRPDQTWFFKLVGPSAALEPHVENFARLVGSVRFEPDAAWTLPEGWTQVEGSGMRAATILVTPPDPPLELTVVRLGGDGGGVLSNVNRWREQLGLPPIDAARLESGVRRVARADGEAILVDLQTAPSEAPAGGMTFDLPAGWTQNPAPGQGRLYEFQAGPDVLVTVSALGGTGGGAAANVNRWRGQVGLPPVEAPEIREVRAKDAVLQYVELFGREKAIVGAFLLGDASSLFFKMSGPADRVRARAPEFEAFLASVRIGD